MSSLESVAMSDVPKPSSSTKRKASAVASEPSANAQFLRTREFLCKHVVPFAAVVAKRGPKASMEVTWMDKFLRKVVEDFDRGYSAVNPEFAAIANELKQVDDYMNEVIEKRRASHAKRRSTVNDPVAETDVAATTEPAAEPASATEPPKRKRGRTAAKPAEVKA